MHYISLYTLELPPTQKTITTRIIPFLVGNPYKPSLETVTGWGVDRIYTHVLITKNVFSIQSSLIFSTEAQPKSLNFKH